MELSGGYYESRRVTLEDGTLSGPLRHTFHQIQYEPNKKIFRALRVKGWRKPDIAALLYYAFEAANETLLRLVAMFSVKSVQQ